MNKLEGVTFINLKDQYRVQFEKLIGNWEYGYAYLANERSVVVRVSEYDHEIFN